MAEKVRYLSDLELHGNMAFALPVTDFPASAEIGTMVLKGTSLYCYIKLGDLETWFPFAKETNSYVHTQGVASATWTVNHSLGTASIWYQVRDETGAIQQVGKTDVSVNTFTLNFTCPMLGTVVVVAPDSINVPEVKASSISIGSNVIIDSSGVRVNGNYVLTSANIATQIATAVSSETDRATLAETSLSTATAAVATSLTSERNRALASESNLSSDISDVSTSITTEISRALSAESTLSTDISNHANDSSIHTTMTQVNSAIQAVVGAAPDALNTLKEIADQLSNDESAVSALTIVVSSKVDKVTGFALSSNDYTSIEKSKLAGIESGAQVNTVTSVAGKTGIITLNKNDIGLTDVDNTSDDKKPISFYTQLELDTKAPVNNPTFTGNVTGLGVATGTSFNSITGLSSTAPLIAGTAAVGTSTLAARQDHVHPVQTTISGNAGSASKLAVAQSISITGDLSYTSPLFDGSSSVTATGTLSNSGITAGTYNNSATAVKPIIFDAKGRSTGVGVDVTITPAWSSITGKPTTLSGYAITDAQGLNSNLTSVAALSTASTGLVKMTNGVASFDSTAYSTLALGSTVGAGLGTASAGIATTAARSDHVHPYNGRFTILDHSGVSNTVNITNGTLSILSRSLVTNSISIGAL